MPFALSCCIGNDFLIILFIERRWNVAFLLAVGEFYLQAWGSVELELWGPWRTEFPYWLQSRAVFSLFPSLSLFGLLTCKKNCEWVFVASIIPMFETR